MRLGELMCCVVLEGREKRRLMEGNEGGDGPARTLIACVKVMMVKEFRAQGMD